MKILIDDDIPYIKGIFEPYAEVLYLKGAEFSKQKVSDADALIIRTRTKCDSALLEGSSVKLIASATIGFDHIDMKYCDSAGIKVETAAGSNARGVLQWVAAALVYASHQQGWRPEEKTMGIIGIGNVGSIVAEYAKHWGFNVLLCDPPRRKAGEKGPGGEDFVACNKILSDADIFSFHVPLTREGEDATNQMVNSYFFNEAKPGSLILNSSRGEIINTTFLNRALIEGRYSCCIDTWEYEPNINTVTLEKSMLATPHVAGYSAQGKANATSMVVQAVAKEFNLPLSDWYPYDKVPKTTPRLISWEELSRTITEYYDIQKESIALKASPRQFEEMRNNYTYRQEYF